MSTTLPVFHKPTFGDVDCIPLMQVCPSRCCEYSFANMYMWRNLFNTEIARVGDAVYIRFSGEDEPNYLAPAGGDFLENLHRLEAVAAAEGHPLRIFGYDENGMDRLEAERTVLSREEFEEEFDYLYRVSDLATLAGKKYHGKRNHIAAFSREHEWVYEPLSAENVADIHSLADEWYTARVALQGDGDGALLEEKNAIHDLLDHRDEVGIVGGLIRVGEKAVAFTFGCRLCADTFDTLVEKALPDYAGAYTVINREFAKNASSEYTYVNRENDVGSEGLRRAKHSYHPVMLVKKTLCTLGEETL